jgi:geranylgeranyl pyrophosphate synthase
MRRGDLCSYKKFGVDVAINAGTLMMVGPITKLPLFVPEKHQLKCHRILSEELTNLHIG